MPRCTINGQRKVKMLAVINFLGCPGSSVDGGGDGSGSGGGGSGGGGGNCSGRGPILSVNREHGADESFMDAARD